MFGNASTAIEEASAITIVGGVTLETFPLVTEVTSCKL